MTTIEHSRGLTDNAPQAINQQAPSLQAYWTLGFSLSVLPLLLRAEWLYRQMPQLPRAAPTADLPSLSIVIPARNEAHNLQRLLPSLLAQRYPGELEIIVVDDHSTDGTAEVVQCAMHDLKYGMLPGVEGVPARTLRLLPVSELPDGWLGKPNASHRGACAARGEWLLFTDADTEHTPFSASSAVAFAAGQGLDGLSIFLQQETRGLLDSAVLMVAFAGLFAGMRRTAPTMNGQFILVKRAVYEASGGFAAVRAEMMDDLAFGRLLSDQGYRAPMMRGETLASVHMYDNERHLWHGVGRLGSGSLRYNGLMALVPAVLITGVMTPLWTLLFNRQHTREIPRLWWIWLASMAGFVPWARQFTHWERPVIGEQAAVEHAGTSSARALPSLRMALMAVVSPAAAIFLQASTLAGFFFRLLGRGVFWKGRNV